MKRKKLYQSNNINDYYAEYYRLRNITYILFAIMFFSMLLMGVTVKYWSNIPTSIMNTTEKIVFYFPYVVFIICYIIFFIINVKKFIIGNKILDLRDK